MTTRTTQDPPGLMLAPRLDAEEIAFLAGFTRLPLVRHADSDDGGSQTDVEWCARIWPGQPCAPSPWVPCVDGCCLVLAGARPGADLATQWLRFVLGEFVGRERRVSGWVPLAGEPGRGTRLLIVDDNHVFLGERDDWSG